MEKESFDKVLKIMEMFERKELKGQVKKGKEVMCKASGFKDLRKMKLDDCSYVLDLCIEKKITFTEIKIKAKEMKRMNEVQQAFMDGVGESCWEDVIAK